jgi:hypothetical protein
MMSQEFLPDDKGFARPNDASALESEQDVVLVTIVSSPKGVRETILTLYQVGFAAVGDWSPLQRTANPKQVMSVLIRRRKRQA